MSLACVFHFKIPLLLEPFIVLISSQSRFFKVFVDLDWGFFVISMNFCLEINYHLFRIPCSLFRDFALITVFILLALLTLLAEIRLLLGIKYSTLYKNCKLNGVYIFGLLFEHNIWVFTLLQVEVNYFDWYNFSRKAS